MEKNPVGVQEGEWPTKWAERGWDTRVWGRVTLMMDARVVLDFQCVGGHRA